MKPKAKLIACILLIGVITITSCKKEKVEVQTVPQNKPPVAHAGPNQTITLPVDTALLNGSGSTDPENSIAAGCKPDCRYAASGSLFIRSMTLFHLPLRLAQRRVITFWAPFLLHLCPESFSLFWMRQR